MLSDEINALFSDPVNLIAQILGFIAMGTGILVYQFNKHGTIMFIKVLIATLWCVHYILLGLWPAVAINILNIIRDSVYGLREKKNLNSPLIPTAFVIASFIPAIFTWENWGSLVPMIASVFSCIAHWQSNTKKLKILALPGNILWLGYDLVNKSWSGSVNDSFVIGSIVVSLIRITIGEKKKEKLQEKTAD